MNHADQDKQDYAERHYEDALTIDAIGWNEFYQRRNKSMTPLNICYCPDCGTELNAVNEFGNLTCDTCDAVWFPEEIDCQFETKQESRKIMSSKYAVGDPVEHTVFGTKTTGTISKVESMDSITDSYIYQIDNGSWWIAESDLTLVQYRPPEVTHQIKTIDDILGLISALWGIDDSAIVSFKTNAHPMTICMAGKDQSQASFLKEMIATIMLQMRRSIRVFIEISEPNKPKVFYQYIRGRNDK